MFDIAPQTTIVRNMSHYLLLENYRWSPELYQFLKPEKKYLHVKCSCYQFDMGLAARKPDFILCEQQRHVSACVSAQSDQSLCCSPSVSSLHPTCQNSSL